MKSILLALVFVSVPAFAQDTGIDLAQQAAQQATQQAIQMQQQQIQITNQVIQQMNDVSSLYFPQSSGPVIGVAATPTFSVKSGQVAPDTVVTMKSATHYATIYFTTDGWTPNANSPHYTGPIRITSETHIQAIAIGPNTLRSPVARADYWTKSLQIPAAPAGPAQPILVQNGVLRAGTPLRLATAAEVSSKTAEVGDKVALVLDQEVKAGDKVVAAKGTPVDAVLTVADPAGRRGLPGDLVFEVRAFDDDGKTVRLTGREILEGGTGHDHQDAVINPKMIVMATVAADAKVTP
jgi:hypothetical protein